MGDEHFATRVNSNTDWAGDMALNINLDFLESDTRVNSGRLQN
jgi:hypothetical protein